MTPSHNFGKGLVANSTYTADGCDDLPAYDTGEQIVSCWRLTWRERLQVLFGGRVFLWIEGKRQPPVMLETSISIGEAQA